MAGEGTTLVGFLPPNICLGWRGLTRTSTSLLQTFVNYRHKMFLDIGPNRTDLIFTWMTTKCLEQLWILKVIPLPISIHKINFLLQCRKISWIEIFLSKIYYQFFLWMTYHRQAFDKTMNENGYLLPFRFLSKAFDCTMPQDDTLN